MDPTKIMNSATTKHEDSHSVDLADDDIVLVAQRKGLATTGTTSTGATANGTQASNAAQDSTSPSASKTHNASGSSVSAANKVDGDDDLANALGSLSVKDKDNRGLSPGVASGGHRGGPAAARGGLGPATPSWNQFPPSPVAGHTPNPQWMAYMGAGAGAVGTGPAAAAAAAGGLGGGSYASHPQQLAFSPPPSNLAQQQQMWGASPQLTASGPNQQLHSISTNLPSNSGAPHDHGHGGRQDLGHAQQTGNLGSRLYGHIPPSSLHNQSSGNQSPYSPSTTGNGLAAYNGMIPPQANQMNHLAPQYANMMGNTNANIGLGANLGGYGGNEGAYSPNPAMAMPPQDPSNGGLLGMNYPQAQFYQNQGGPMHAQQGAQIPGLGVGAGQTQLRGGAVPGQEHLTGFTGLMFGVMHINGIPQQNPDGTGPNPNNRKVGLYKTEICRNWEETNDCVYGTKCQYAHGQDELRKVVRHPKYKTEICKTFLTTGTCPYGKRCVFIHQQEGSDQLGGSSTPTSGDLTNGGPLSPSAGNGADTNGAGAHRRNLSNTNLDERPAASMLARINAQRESNAAGPGGPIVNAAGVVAGASHFRHNRNMSSIPGPTSRDLQQQQQQGGGGVASPGAGSPYDVGGGGQRSGQFVPRHGYSASAHAVIPNTPSSAYGRGPGAPSPA